MRKRFNFWLDDKNKADWQVNDLITTLKSRGQFTRAIREGVRLWVACRDNNPAVLCELFPKLAEKLGATIIEKPIPPSDGANGNELAKEIAAQIILQGGTPGYMLKSAAAPVQPTGKLLGGKAPAMPMFEDDDQPTVLIRANTSIDSSKNFIEALRHV